MSRSQSLLSCAEFLGDVSGHVLEVLRDDGVYRHIRLREPGTMMQHFDIVTWPGYLCYVGDMGTYVFTRLTDMLEFFRHPRRDDGSLYVNHSYWSEKLVAVDGQRKGGAAKEFSEDKFRKVINDYRLGWIRSNSETRRNMMRGQKELLTKEQRRELWEAVEDEVFGAMSDNGEHGAYQAAYDFLWKPSGYTGRFGWSFTDLFEHDFTEYTHRFQWCCFALSWGIEQYDAHMAALQKVPA